MLLCIRRSGTNAKDFRVFGCQTAERYSWKPKHPVYIIVFGVVTSDGNAIPSFIFPTYAQTQHRCLHQVLGGGSAVLDWEGGCTMPHKQNNSLACEKISATTSPLTSSHLTPWIAVLLIIMYGLWLSKRPIKLCEIPKMNWRQG